MADDDSDAGVEDGIATDVFSLLCAGQSVRSANVFMAFAGATGEGLGINGLGDVNGHAYFKVIGRVSSEDASVPVGALPQSDLHSDKSSGLEQFHNAISSTCVADNADGGVGCDGAAANGRVYNRVTGSR